MESSDEFEQLSTYSSATQEENQQDVIKNPKKGDNDTDKGRKDVYRCNLVKRRRPQCQAEICLLYNSHNVKLTLFNNGNQHTHDQILEQQTKTGINEATKHYIQTYGEKVIDESNEDEVDIIQEPPTKRIACNQIDKTSSTIQVEPSTSGKTQESSVTQPVVKKRPGRPKGSKNKK
ncbi:hypothetical protein BpHYR1_002197 [Brachionus plicatilis]|uniref:Uncharacterized protein n=1 Tax=Brachionus plicatilis TaxID=10195 RepID=A0A3M7R1M7_BRAPC|nr:hypothetical protein BpHYR1_002197 [Brachionus plicatilis]